MACTCAGVNIRFILIRYELKPHWYNKLFLLYPCGFFVGLFQKIRIGSPDQPSLKFGKLNSFIIFLIKGCDSMQHIDYVGKD